MCRIPETITKILVFVNKTRFLNKVTSENVDDSHFGAERQYFNELLDKFMECTPRKNLDVFVLNSVQPQEIQTMLNQIHKKMLGVSSLSFPEQSFIA